MFISSFSFFLTRFNQTPLHKAVENGSTQTVLLLLKNYCDPNVKAEKQGTPLEIAKREGKVEIVKLLEATEEEIMEKSTYEAFQGTKENLFVREGIYLNFRILFFFN